METTATEKNAPKACKPEKTQVQFTWLESQKCLKMQFSFSFGEQMGNDIW